MGGKCSVDSSSCAAMATHTARNILLLELRTQLYCLWQPEDGENCNMLNDWKWSLKHKWCLCNSHSDNAVLFSWSDHCYRHRTPQQLKPVKQSNSQTTVGTFQKSCTFWTKGKRTSEECVCTKQQPPRTTYVVCLCHISYISRTANSYTLRKGWFILYDYFLMNYFYS